MAYPLWVAKYIGVPFMDYGRSMDGVDCWGLVWLILNEEFGANIPSYAGEYNSTVDRGEVSRIICQEGLDETGSKWIDVSDKPRMPGDIVLLYVAGKPCHVGVMISKDTMVHVFAGVDTCIERVNNPHWNSRKKAYYRPKEMMDASRP